MSHYILSDRDRQVTSGPETMPADGDTWCYLHISEFGDDPQEDVRICFDNARQMLAFADQVSSAAASALVREIGAKTAERNVRIATTMCQVPKTLPFNDMVDPDGC